jgi:negative regulator of sigma E activity
MSEHIQEQISEFIDDEMSADACEFFIRRLEHDEEARARYFRYQLIGAAVRGEHLAFNAACVTGAEQQPVTMELESVQRSSRPAKRRVAAGLGIAASLVLVTIFAFSGLDRADDATFTDTTSSELQRAPFQGDAMGMQYLMQHTGYATGLSRTIVHSSVIAGPQLDWSDDVGEDESD